ncbi:MAG: NAD-dependent epimerase/dehydratase family protein [Xanthobacteraceae bacterium]|nr:NAD-dependent epimerase/dehydratase family protein [Xanthobacteraceae bacterium]
MGKSYVITGGAGFVGRALCRALLEAGDSVLILDRRAEAVPGLLHPRCERIAAESLNLSDLRRTIAVADGCFHLATQAPVVLVAAAAARVPVVLASSAAVYGRQRDEPVREDALLEPRTPYGLEKLTAESAARAAHHAEGLPVLCLRFFNIYGPGQIASRPLSGVIAKYLSALAAGHPLEVEGDGQQKRDFLFVDDAVAFLRAAMAWLRATGGYAELNACTGQPVTILDLVGIAMRVTQRRSERSHTPPRADGIRWSYGNPDAARSLLGVSARVSLADGLRLTWLAPTPGSVEADPAQGQNH